MEIPNSKLWGSFSKQENSGFKKINCNFKRTFIGPLVPLAANAVRNFVL